MRRRTFHRGSRRRGGVGPLRRWRSSRGGAIDPDQRRELGLKVDEGRDVSSSQL